MGQPSKGQKGSGKAGGKGQKAGGQKGDKAQKAQNKGQKGQNFLLSVAMIVSIICCIGSVLLAFKYG